LRSCRSSLGSGNGLRLRVLPRTPRTPRENNQEWLNPRSTDRRVRLQIRPASPASVQGEPARCRRPHRAC
jgi:hypothetical protein